MGNPLAARWLGLRATTAGVADSVPGRGTQIPQAAWRDQK